MVLSELKKILECSVFIGEDQLSENIDYGCASDLMSDVLAFSRAGAALLTGLVNVQTIHTAVIAEIKAVVFVRGKKPETRMIELAKEKNIALLGTPYSMYEACGILYQKGLISTMKPVTTDASYKV